LLKFLKKANNKISKFKDSNIQDLEKNLLEKIGLNVLIKNNRRNKGTITFLYKDLDQLNKIIEIIKSNY
jgi:ParB family chromosome partitioning protein